MATLSPSFGVQVGPILSVGVGGEDLLIHKATGLHLVGSDGLNQSNGVVLPSFGSGVGIPGYPVRSGDTLLVVDATGKMVGILPG